MDGADQLIMIKVADLKLGKYQRMPSRSEPEFGEFVADVKINGIRDAIYLDEENNVLDGHTRVLAAQQCKITELKAIKLEGLTETEKLERAYGQSRRRHLNRKQLQEITVAAIKEFSEYSPGYVAKFAPASDRTIAKLRSKLIAAGEIEDLQDLIALDGKKHPVVKKTARKSSGSGGGKQPPKVISGKLKKGRKNLTIEAEGLAEVGAADEVRIFPTSFPQKLVREALAAGQACLIMPQPKADDAAD